MVRYILQGCKTAIIGVLTGVCFTACTQDNLADTQGEILPEGKYPLELTASGLDVVASPTTRATVDGNWEDVRSVPVHIESDVLNKEKDYKAVFRVSPTADNISASLQKFNPVENDMDFWQTSTEVKTIEAWWWKRLSINNQPTDSFDYLDNWSWEVQQNQSDVNAYQNSDFIYAYEKISFNERTRKPLAFHHQTAKVVINIRFGEGVNGTTVSEVTINNTKLKGKFARPTASPTENAYYGLTVDSEVSALNITPHQLRPANTNVAFDSGSYIPYNADASYEALVIPQTVKEGDSFITINVDGTAYHYRPYGGLTLQAGTVHTFNITVRGTALDVRTESTISWDPTGGSNGNGTVGI